MTAATAAIAKVKANQEAGREYYDGMTSSEIGDYNRYLMFGADDEAFPSQREWSMIVD
jgi:hypothetical protein